MPTIKLPRFEAGTYVRITKLDAAPEALHPTGTWDNYAPGKINRSVSPPVAYWAEGYITIPPSPGGQFRMGREIRNGVRKPGIMTTSTIERLGAEPGGALLLYTQNSIYRVAAAVPPPAPGMTPRLVEVRGCANTPFVADAIKRVVKYYANTRDPVVVEFDPKLHAQAQYSRGDRYHRIQINPNHATHNYDLSFQWEIRRVAGTLNRLSPVDAVWLLCALLMHEVKHLNDYTENPNRFESKNFIEAAGVLDAHARYLYAPREARARCAEARLTARAVERYWDAVATIGL